MTTKEMIEIMQACDKGKTIEFALLGENKWKIIARPTWNWDKFDYRVKPEKKYRPYKDTNEMIDDWKTRFNPKDWPSYSMPLIWVRYKATNATSLVYCYQFDCVAIGLIRLSLRELFYGNTYLDGSPCGKEITE